MDAKVEIISRELIKPSCPTPHHLKEHKLSFVDQFLDDIFAPFLLFYRNSSINVGPFKTSQHLKQSLADTLTKFYPLAGKLTINPEGFSVVDCDDSGALFVEAKVDAPLQQSLDDEKVVQYLPFDPFSGDEPLLGKYPRNETLFAVQITHFECGGSAVGVCISHALVDLSSFLTFLNSWAVMNRGGEGKLSDKHPMFDLGMHLFPPQEQQARPPREVKEARKLALKKFVFNKEKIIQLKTLASMSQTLKDPTRVEVVSAFLWKQLMKVTSTLTQSAVSETKFLFKAGHMVNLRGRISSLSDQDDVYHFGNLAVHSTTDSFSTTAKDVVDEDGIDFADLVGLIRSAIRKVDDDFVVNYTNTPRLIKDETHWRNFVSFCRCPTNEVDFGWGKPCLVCPGYADYPDVKLLETSEGVIEAWISLFEGEMGSLPQELLSLQATRLFHLNS